MRAGLIEEMKEAPKARHNQKRETRNEKLALINVQRKKFNPESGEYQYHLQFKQMIEDNEVRASVPIEVAFSISETGELAAVMDGRYITEVRTAAASAVSVRHLARSNAKTLAILGSGVQARSHLEALSRVHSLRQITVWSPQQAHRNQFVDWAKTVTTGSTPVTPPAIGAVHRCSPCVSAARPSSTRTSAIACSCVCGGLW